MTLAMIPAMTLTMTAPLIEQPFLFLRHGQSTGNRDGIVCGSLDRPLTEEGERQALAAAEAVARHAPDLAVTTPLERAWRTAELALSRTTLRAERDPRLQERHWGVFEGGPVAAVDNEAQAPEGGESWDTFAARVTAGLAEWLPKGERPLVVAHSGVYRVLLHLATGRADGPRVPNGVPVLVTPACGHDNAWRFETLEL